MEGDCVENHLWVVEPAELRSDLLSAKVLVKTTEQEIVPVRVLNLSDQKKVISKNSEVGQCATVEAVINSEQLPKPAEMSAKDQHEFDVSVEKWVVGLAAPERNKAKKLLKRYACAFATNKKRQGRTAMVKHEIDTGEARPIKQANRNIQQPKRNEVKELVDEMKRSGGIEPSSDPWILPVVLVKKKDGSTRFCIDYRKLNDVTKTDS